MPRIRLEDESGVFQVEGGHPRVEGRSPGRVEAPRREGEMASHRAYVRRREGRREDTGCSDLSHTTFQLLVLSGTTVKKGVAALPTAPSQSPSRIVHPDRSMAARRRFTLLRVTWRGIHSLTGGAFQGGATLVLENARVFILKNIPRNTPRNVPSGGWWCHGKQRILSDDAVA